MADVAIIGMACLFPGAPDLETFWANICAGVDAIGDVPAGRLDPVFFTGPGAFPVRRGGFVDDVARFDAARHGVMPVAARGAEPDQLLALDVAVAALRDAGYDAKPFARERAGVFLGRGGYAGAGRVRLEQHTRGAEQLVTSLRALVPSLSEEQLATLKAEFQAALGPGAASPDAAIGLVPNLAASRIAHRLDLHGPAFTVDAACASALVAVDQACAELASGRCDLVLAGGVHLCQDEAFWSVFSQLGALSKGQRIRPFDRGADGLLIGEGVGIVVLKRAADAERDGDRVYARVRGTGVASDGRGASLMSPSVDGQVRALERAWQDAGLDPKSVELVEAHGTATAAGDAAELETLRRVFGAAEGDHRAGLGSVKSMIGHAMPAAGAAGLIKAALAAHHGVLPPSLHCDEPSAAVAATRFRVITTAEPWPAGAPRRAAVNAFGFGGINAHVVLDGVPARAPVRAPARERVLALCADSPAALAAALPASCPESFRRQGQGPCRLVVLDPTPERLARARVIVEKGRPWGGREDIWFAPRGLLHDGGKVAFLFPGVDAAFAPRVHDVCARFGLPLPAGVEGASLEETGLGIIGVNRLLDRVLGELGVRGDLMAGHSIGEWSAMLAAGAMSDAIVAELAPAVRAGALAVPGVLFGAAGCGREQAEQAMAGLPDIALSHDNCPHQVLICGVEASLDSALARLKAKGVLCQKLAFQSGFHTPLFAPHVGPHRERFARMALGPARVPLFSATTTEEMPADAAGKRALCVEHLLKPVRFRELVLRLHARGARLFIQVGTGSLCGFVEDTLRGQPHTAIAANDAKRGGVEQLLRLLATFFVEGGEPRWERLLGHHAGRPSAGELLPLGVPLVHPRAPLALAAAAPPARPAPATPLGAAFAASLEAIERAGAEVLAATAPQERTSTRVLSMASMPELIDHTFFRQPPGWPVVSDRHPVVPMTALIALMIDAARELAPRRLAVAVEDARAFRWLVVSTPVAARFHARLVGRDRVAVAIDGYAEAVVVFADAYAPAPAYTPAPRAPGEPTSGAQIYRDRWMFHGPQYQGVVEVGPIGDHGLHGVLEAGRACGALLDNAGQLFGYWVMQRNEINRLAMPVHIARLSLYGPDPAPGTRLDCDVRITRQDERAVVADLVLAAGGRVWATIDAWEDRRFETDPRLWDVFLHPEDHLLAVPDGEDVVFRDVYRLAPTREQLERRFLGERERAEYEELPPRQQRAWLATRIAAKDAVRHLLWRHGAAPEPIWPVEIELSPDARTARFRGGAPLSVSVTVDGDLARARATSSKN